MKREQLEKLIGKRVRVTLFDDVIEGELHKTGEEKFKNDPNLYIPRNYYFLEDSRSYLFRLSAIKKIEVL